MITSHSWLCKTNHLPASAKWDISFFFNPKKKLLQNSTKLCFQLPLLHLQAQTQFQPPNLLSLPTPNWSSGQHQNLNLIVFSTNFTPDLWAPIHFLNFYSKFLMGIFCAIQSILLHHPKGFSGLSWNPKLAR